MPLVLQVTSASICFRCPRMAMRMPRIFLLLTLSFKLVRQGEQTESGCK